MRLRYHGSFARCAGSSGGRGHSAIADPWRRSAGNPPRKRVVGQFDDRRHYQKPK
jgi:hypothetical protein